MGEAIAATLDTIKEKAGVKAREVAELLSTTPQTVSRWQSGRASPRRESLHLLLHLEWLARELSDLYTVEEARLWLFRPNILLDKRTPASLIQEGKIDEVLRVVDQLQSGAFV